MKIMSADDTAPSAAHLLVAAGYKILSEGWAQGERSIHFSSADGKDKHVIKSNKDYKDGWPEGDWYIRQAVVEWLSARGEMPDAQTALMAMLKRDMQANDWQLDQLRGDVYRLTEALAALRASGTQDKAIKVWAWRDAPLELRALSAHGGDEDWVALIPPGVNDDPAWMDGGAFGCCYVSRQTLPDGSVLRIGAHS